MVAPLVSHRDFASLHPTGDHVERPERVAVLLDAFAEFEEPRRATQQELALCHDADYISKIQAVSESGRTVMLDADTVCTPSTYETARLAAGGAIAVAENGGFAAVRPPGHHALPDRPMGFCIFNNVAIAARYLQKVHGIRRVLIVDFDYHHGNGTQDIFYDDDSVFYFSTHHYGAYPGTGSAAETGRGKGLGTTLNVPLPPGASDAQILAAFEQQLVPAARRFKPDFILVSAGFDGMRKDLLGQFDITPQGYAAITRVIVRLADELCQGRIVSVLEGGYRLDGLAESVAAHVKALRGE